MNKYSNMNKLAFNLQVNRKNFENLVAKFCSKQLGLKRIINSDE